MDCTGHGLEVDPSQVYKNEKGVKFAESFLAIAELCYVKMDGHIKPNYRGKVKV